MELSEKEMIRLWLLRKGFEPLRSDCRIERSDGADLEALARQECRLWYGRLLRQGPREALEAEDISGREDLSMGATRLGSIIIRLPADCVRVLEVKLRSWDAPAVPMDWDSPDGRRQVNPFYCGGPGSPVALLLPDNRVELFSNTYDGEDILDYLFCATRPGPDEEGNPVYRFAEAALDLIPTEL